MITTSTSGYTSSVIAITATSFPNIFLGITGSTPCSVKLQRECEDGVYRSYEDTEYTSCGAREKCDWVNAQTAIVAAQRRAWSRSDNRSFV